MKNQIKQILKDALERIRKEKPNLEHILQDKPYSSPAHQKAVTETSFLLLKQDIAKLITIRKFKSTSVKILKLIKDRNTKDLLKIINKLEPNLEKHYNSSEKQTNPWKVWGIRAVGILIIGWIFTLAVMTFPRL
ncbi:MAG: hypothetical protein WBD24_06300 [Candidatus Omnitrophota bacterium]